MTTERQVFFLYFMFVSGFTFIRNALKYDYPIIESILSILPICDEVIVMVGNSEDNTRTLIESIKSEKIKIFDSIWDDSLREGGQVLAIETNKAFSKINPKADWAFYIQGDEVLHEKYHSEINKKMLEEKDNANIDGLLFGYTHFYGSYDYVGDSYSWYQNEIRVVKNNKKIYSYKDAQGFRKNNNEKLSVKKIDAKIYHYGWVKPPEAMQKKQESFNKFWHDDQWMQENVAKVEEFDYSKINALRKFDDSHPMVMKDRIKNKNWKFDFDLSRNRYSTKEKIIRLIEKVFKKRIGEYKNYILVKK